jgi:arylsulfatase A-like enzyme
MRLAAFFFLLCCQPLCQAQDRPNVVFMMCDDQRYDALSCAGNSILKTPNLDRIAAEGMTFKNAFVTNSLCAPSRATILTGLYSHVHGGLITSTGSFRAT